jgi:hypothetical protein
MVKKKITKKSKKSNKQTGFKKFITHQYFLSFAFIVVIIGAFLGLYFLSNSDQAMTGEAYKLLRSNQLDPNKALDPYMTLAKEYRNLKIERGETFSFKEFNSAIYESNEFKQRIGSKKVRNKFRDINNAVNGAYSSNEDFSLIANTLINSQSAISPGNEIETIITENEKRGVNPIPSP